MTTRAASPLSTTYQIPYGSPNSILVSFALSLATNGTEELTHAQFGPREAQQDPWKLTAAALTASVATTALSNFAATPLINTMLPPQEYPFFNTAARVAAPFVISPLVGKPIDEFYGVDRAADLEQDLSRLAYRRVMSLGMSVLLPAPSDQTPPIYWFE